MKKIGNEATMPEAYPWYETIQNDGTLRQGDILDSCPVFTPLIKGELGDDNQLDYSRDESDVVIMTQSCDLDNDPHESVLLCPVFSLEEFPLKGKNHLNSILKGNRPAFHMLEKHNEGNFHRERSIVDFRMVYTLPFDFLSRFAGDKAERLRLLPPYREHLSQAFARYFMRVGLPSSIVPFK